MRRDQALRARKHLPAAVTVWFCLLCAALGWGGYDHVRINRMAAKAVPDDMAAWREYHDVLAKNGYQPDLWKGDDPTEEVRHYIDLESYGFPETPLPPGGPADPLDRRGIVPWQIIRNIDLMAAAMRSNDWETATRIAAATGHYVGDLHQPLHCTSNFDGQDSGNNGVHMRWETQMPKRVWEARQKPDVPEVTLLPDDPWPEIEQWIRESQESVDAILEADTAAYQAGRRDISSDRYFETLWEESHEIYQRRIGQAAARLASVWYAAWVRAGQPEIPPPPAEISTASIYAPPGRKFRHGESTTWIFFVVLGIFAVLIIGGSIRKQMGEQKKRQPSKPGS